jgi:hypothetical protein
MALSSYVILLMVLISVVGLWGASNFNNELKKSYPAHWKKFQPSFSARSILQELRWTEFVMLRKYRKFGNRRLSMFGNLLFCYGLIVITFMVAWAFIPHGPAPPPGLG